MIETLEKSSASTPAPSPATSTFSVDSATAAHPSDPCAETIANLLQLLPSLLSSTSDITATTVTSTATRFEYLLGTLQHAYSHQQKHSDALQTRLRNLTRSFKSNQEQLDERDRAVRVLNEEVAKGRADVEEMKRALKGESTTANFYRQEMEKLQGIAAEREEKLVSAEERAASVERVLAEVRAEKTLIEADLKERTVLVDRLMTEFVPRVRLDEALAEKEVLERDRDECYDLINDLEREHTELTATCAQLKLTNAELASVNAELTATVAEHSAVLEQKQLDHDLMDTMWQQRVFERDERMAEMTATLDALLREGELLKQEQATLLEENAVLVQNQRSVVGTAHISTMTEVCTADAHVQAVTTLTTVETQTDDDKTNEYKAAAETLTDSAAQTSDAFLGLLKQAEIAVREFKTMKFANALMYEQVCTCRGGSIVDGAVRLIRCGLSSRHQMEENQRKYGTELQEARQQITYD